MSLIDFAIDRQQQRRPWQRLKEEDNKQEVKSLKGRNLINCVIVEKLKFNQMLHLISALAQLMAALNLATTTVHAVQVQRLNVPDLVVIENNNNQQMVTANQRLSVAPLSSAWAAGSASPPPPSPPNSKLTAVINGPEAASLIQTQPPTASVQQITFECLVSYDQRRDRNLVVKWHHDERMEPIYQWIPELNKRSIASQYRAYIVPIISQANGPTATTTTKAIGDYSNSTSTPTNQTLLSAGFKLVRPTKELGGKYTCSAISSQNDDSKSKKMIVYTPPRSFSFNATRANLAALFASQRDRLLQLSQQPQAQTQPNSQLQLLLPPAYRMRSSSFDNQLQASTQATTLSPQMLSTIDYVNVNQQRARHQQTAPRTTFYWPNNATTAAAAAALASPQQQVMSNLKRPQFGLKLVCDIDQVFPVPEVSIYRLAKLDGSHPEKLAKLDTRIERDIHSGLFHVQVISVVDDEDLLARYYHNHNYYHQQQTNSSEQMSAPPPPPPLEIYFECLIALTNLELSRYADNRRTIIYRPGALASSSRQQGLQTNENMDLEQVASGGQSMQPQAASLLLVVIVTAATAIGPFLLSFNTATSTTTTLLLHKWQYH